MTTEEVINELNLMEMVVRTPKAAEAVKIATAALRAQQEQESNEPLTLDELREMEGKPVWVTHRDGSGGRWGIVNIYGNRICADVCAGSAYWFNDYCRNIAYRHKPEEGTI